jgi:hypothetical protein
MAEIALDLWMGIFQRAGRRVCARGVTWLLHYAASRKEAGSIPNRIIRFLYWSNPSSRTMALGSFQP